MPLELLSGIAFIEPPIHCSSDRVPFMLPSTDFASQHHHICNSCHPDFAMIVQFIRKIFHKIRIISFCPAFLSANHPFPCAKFIGQEYPASAIADIFKIFFLWTSWFYGHWNNGIVNQLTWTLIKADNRRFRLFVKIHLLTFKISVILSSSSP